VQWCSLVGVGVFIKGVVDGGPAALDGRLQVLSELPRTILRVVYILGLWILGWVDCNGAGNRRLATKC